MDLTSGLIGHWKLSGDCRDHSGNGNHGVNHGADLTAKDGATFDGQASCIEVPSSLRPGPGDFSISLHAHTDERLDDVLGDLLSQYDPVTRTGFNFDLQNFAGVTAAQANHRHLHFGIDAGRIDPAWTDCGRPGNNLRVYSLTVYEGQLYTGTFEHGADEAGHVYRYTGGTRWIDCGSPDPCNTVASLAVYHGRLYAGSSRYKAGGSALPDSPNQHPGGNIYRYEGGKVWTPCGHLEGADSIAGLAVYRGDLYAIPLYSQGVFRYKGGTEWTSCGTPGVRMMSLTVFNGHLYGAGNEGEGRGGVYRYEGGTTWTRTGDQPGVTQVYSFATYQGKLYVGTWPDGTVFRYDGGEIWTNVGRLGQEKEVMAMMVYNGKLYAGTLPLAEVYRYDGGTTWTRTGQLDTTPDVKYRRVWSMAVFQGRLFGGTLPSGHVYALEAGKSVTYDHELKPGWRHLVAVRHGDRLKLYVDGRLAATSSPFNPADYDLSSDSPLRIGFGAHDHFNGKIRDLRIYNRALTDTEVEALGGV
ncbi:MAG: LamG domain-containing protein [Candidatus Latescibacteria bacterium]|nr:LamG domain-containing protein [Candidatus Latescibacterota bacterium]